MKIYKCFLKRFLDLFFSILSLPFVLIVCLPVAIAIKLEDGGSIFYIDYRQGIRAIHFKMLKFRTMYMNAPDIRNQDGSTYNGEDDPRVTKTGRFLRKTSIDELPQIWNVIKGDMSLVGPRPDTIDRPVYEADGTLSKRLWVLPGITGYSQAFFRNSIAQDEKYANDGYYADHISFLFDLRIILKTITSVIRNENVYNNPVEGQ